VLGVPRATVYRKRNPRQQTGDVVRAKPARALSDDEREEVLKVLRSERFVDQAPASVYATLLDEDGIYLCSIRTMYRILEEHGEMRERRDQLRHPNYQKPELLATGPNQVWSWDITKLLGPAKWTYYYLYVIMDIFSRYVVACSITTTTSLVVLFSRLSLVSGTCFDNDHRHSPRSSWPFRASLLHPVPRHLRHSSNLCLTHFTKTSSYRGSSRQHKNHGLTYQRG
jgi:hypothetical protein